MGPDFGKVMVSRVEIYPLQRVTALHPAIYSKDCKGKFQGMKIPPQIYLLEGNFFWYPGSQKSGAMIVGEHAPVSMNFLSQSDEEYNIKPFIGIVIRHEAVL